MNKKIHTFAVCAYKESPFLEDCLKSVVAQKIYSDVYIATSTPNDHIKKLAEKYDVPLYIRDGKSDIQDDWNFATSHATTEWVTVAHQDDVYDPNYAKEIIKQIKDNPKSYMAYCDYRPIIHGEVSSDLNSKMKRFFQIPMRSKFLSNIKFFRKYSLAFGNSISCPCVAYHKSIIEGDIFTSELKFALDWDTFLKYALKDGRFVYVAKKLFYYRIHEGATSSEYTLNNIRKNDEMYMFRKFWPDWLIKIGFQFYKKSYGTYEK